MNMHHQISCCTEDRSADALVRIVLSALLDGIHEQLSKCGGDIVASLLRKIGFKLFQEVGGTVGSFNLAAKIDGDPFRNGGHKTDIVLPGGGIESLLHHLGKRRAG